MMSKNRLIIKGNNSMKGCNKVKLDRIEWYPSCYFSLQVAIFRAMKASSMTRGKKESERRDATVARRLMSIVVSDFLCWFPIGCLGLLVAAGKSFR